MSPNVTYHIQVYAYIHDSSGRFVVKVDGITDIDFTGDTKYQSTDQVNQVGFGSSPSAQVGSFQGYIDNFVLDSSDYPGLSYVAKVAPTGAGASAQWTPSAGSNWDCVEEVPASDANYVSCTAVDQVDTYACGDLPAEADLVKAVQVCARSRKEGSPTPQQINVAVRTGGANYFSADAPLSYSYWHYEKLWENNPGTSNPWSVSEVNAIEIGIKSKT
jgi:hypothetical protein